jgi:chromatin remodeling complex protein RSC6
MIVTMRVGLYESNGLAPALHDDVPKAMRRAAPSEESHFVQVSERQHAENQETARNASSNRESARSIAENEEIQNLVFNITGKKYDPAMFPVVVDENNKVLVDFSKYYDPKKGNFPRIMEASKELASIAGNKKGTQVIDIIQAQSGKFVVPDRVASRINWKKIGASAAKVGSFLLMLI